MTAAIRSELLKLTTVRTTAIFLVATAGFVLLAVVFQAAAAGGEFLGPMQDPATQRALFTAGGVATIVAVVFGTLAISGEFRHRTIVPTLLVTPNRISSLLAKAVAGAIGAGGIGLAGVVAAALGTAGALAVTGTPLEIGIGSLTGAWIGTVGASAIGGLVGLGIGGVARNQALAVGSVLLLLLAVEPLIGSLVPDLAPWMPGALSTTIAEPAAATTPTVTAAVLTYLVYGVALTAASALVLRRVDVS